jgi:hypothetical protein
VAAVPEADDAGPQASHVRSAASQVRRGEYSELSSSLVLWLTAAAVVLSLGALALVAARI